MLRAIGLHDNKCDADDHWKWLPHHFIIATYVNSRFIITISIVTMEDYPHHDDRINFLHEERTHIMWHSLMNTWQQPSWHELSQSTVIYGYNDHDRRLIGFTFTPVNLIKSIKSTVNTYVRRYDGRWIRWRYWWMEN